MGLRTPPPSAHFGDRAWPAAPWRDAPSHLGSLRLRFCLVHFLSRVGNEASNSGRHFGKVICSR